MTVRRVDGALRAQAKESYSRAKKAKVVLNLTLGLAARYEALERNAVRGTARLRRPKRKPKSLSIETVQTVRDAVSAWRKGEGLPARSPTDSSSDHRARRRRSERSGRERCATVVGSHLM
jgi:hypothetical protein